MEDKWYFKAYHKFMIVTPVIAILALISIVYFGYIFTYCKVLITSHNNYPFEMTSSIESAYSKGIILFVITSYLALMMFINFFRAVFMDPGYFESPLDLERKIVLKHAGIEDESLKKINFKINPKSFVEPFRGIYKEANNRNQDFDSETEDPASMFNTKTSFYNKDKLNTLKQSKNGEFDSTIKSGNNLINTIKENKDGDFEDNEVRITLASFDDEDQEFTKANPNSKPQENVTLIPNNLSQEEQAILSKFNFLCNFNSLVSTYPLTHQETIRFRDRITHVMREDQIILPEELLEDLTSRNVLEEERDNGSQTSRSINKGKRNNPQENLTKQISLSKNIKIKESGNKEENTLLNISPEKGNKIINAKHKDEDDEIFKQFLHQDLGRNNLCGSCLRKKIERSHHCRMCGKCVLKMDHHCPWLANCIGFRNYKYFLLIHFYGIMACLVITFTYWEAAVNYQFNDDSSIAICWFSSFVYFCNFGLFGFLLWLFIVNWKLMFRNATVIENADKERFPSTKSVNIYDLGCYNNFCAVFGKNPLTWFLPIGANNTGKGLVYPTIYKPNMFKEK